MSDYPPQFWDYAERNTTLLGDVPNAPFDQFSVMCPECGNTICQLYSPELSGFEAICDECDNGIYLTTGIAVADYYREWCKEGEDSDVGKRRFDAVDTAVLKRVLSKDDSLETETPVQ